MGLPEFRLNDNRHTYWTLMLASGVDWRVASGMMGHAGPQSSDRYAHVPTELEVAAAEQFEKTRNAKRMPKGAQQRP